MGAMSHTGCDFLLDVHGDEEVPGVFISGLEGLPGWGPRLEALQGAFVGEWSLVCALPKSSACFLGLCGTCLL
jgi:hypothetical protein